jgi:bifunctional ADP-heptose synthase (sugar kinase/adenylyltransferase)
MDTRTKILDLERASRLGENGRRLRVAAGAFDVLQAAHARLFSRLRPRDGALLVAVWEDASLERPPILPERARAQLVAALAAVDYVVVCAPEGLESLIQKLRPERVERATPGERNIIGEVIERHR